MKNYKYIILCLLPLWAGASEKEVVCVDHLINGQVVKRCFYGGKPSYTRPNGDVGNLGNIPALPAVNPSAANPVPAVNNNPINYGGGGSEERVIRSIDNRYGSSSFNSKIIIKLFKKYSAALKFNSSPGANNPIIQHLDGWRFDVTMPVPGIPEPYGAQMSISKQPNDFNIADKNCMRTFNNSAGTLRASTNTSAKWSCILEPNTDYYLNVRFVSEQGLTTCNNNENSFCGAYVDMVPGKS